MKAFLALALVLAASSASAEDKPLPKFGPEATPIFAQTDFLRDADAPDYWTFSAFYIPQETSSDCSVAAVTMVVNALNGLPENAAEEIVTESSLLEDVADAKWKEQVAEDGPGVTFDDLKRVLRESLDASDLEEATIEAVQPKAADADALTRLKTALAANEESEDDVMLVYFNQGVITGDWDGPHISPVGAYDAANDRVLIMDVDRNWYVPYWTSTATLLAALVKPISEEHGVLAGGAGGYIVVDNE